MCALLDHSICYTCKGTVQKLEYVHTVLLKIVLDVGPKDMIKVANPPRDPHNWLKGALYPLATQVPPPPT